MANTERYSTKAANCPKSIKNKKDLIEKANPNVKDGVFRVNILNRQCTSVFHITNRLKLI